MIDCDDDGDDDRVYDYGKETDIFSKFYIANTFHDDDMPIYPLFCSFFICDRWTDLQTDRQSGGLRCEIVFQ